MFAKKGLLAAAMGLATIAGVSSTAQAQIFGDNFDINNPTRHSILDFSNDGPYGGNSPKRPTSDSYMDDPRPSPAVVSATIRIHNRMGRAWSMVVNGFRQNMPAGTVTTLNVKGPMQGGNQVSFSFDLLNPSGSKTRNYLTPAGQVHDAYVIPDGNGGALLRSHPHQ